MTRKLTRNYSLSVVVPFVAILVLLIAAAALAQTSGAGPMGSNPLFLPVMTYDSGGFYPYSVAVADVNGDGKPDLVVANLCKNDKDGACSFGTLSGMVEVMLGNGDGTFQPAVAYPTGGHRALAVAIADLNGDGKLDLVVANDLTPPIPCGDCSNVAVLLGNGDGTFQRAVTYRSGTESPYNVVIADVNGDGKPDVVVGGANSGVLSVLLGRGDGTLEPAVTYDAGGGDPVTVAVADVNLDGKPDIVVANNNGRVGVLLGNGDGAFQPAVTYGSGGIQPMGVAVADLNSDGNPDVVVTNYLSGNVGVLLGKGDGTFRPAATYSVEAYPLKVAVADINGDGKRDLAVANYGGGVSVLLGNGDGTFHSAIDPVGGAYSSSVAVADVNGDGAPDLLVTKLEPNGDGSVSVVLNTSGPRNTTSTELVSSANPVAPNQTVTYTATVTSQSGGTVDGTVIFQDYISGEPWTVVRTTATLAGNRVEHSTSYAAGGLHIITAMYGGDKGSAGSISAELTEQSEKLPFKTLTVVSTSGSPSFVGQAVTFTATVSSTAGIPPNGENITFTNGSTVLGTATLSGGMASLTTSSLEPGIFTITATYPGDGIFAPSSSPGLRQVVTPTKSATSTTLISSLNPSMYGQKLTFTARVTGSGPVLPTGTVVFMWKYFTTTYTIGTATLNSVGMATLTKFNLNADPYPMIAVYRGDINSLSSTSAVLNQTVLQTTSAAALTSSVNPSTVGQAITFTAKFTSPTVIPSGPVTLKAGTTVLATAQLSGGKATFTTSSLAAGSTRVTVTYYGDSNIAKSSASVIQTVQP